MTILDDEILPLVTEIVSTYGKVVTFQVGTLSEYNPTTSSATEGGPIQYTPKVIPPYMTSQYFGDGTLRQREMQIMLPGENLAFTPTVDHIVIIDGVGHKITKIEPIYSGESIAAYTITIEK